MASEIDVDIYVLKLPNGLQMVLPNVETLDEREFNARTQRTEGEAILSCIAEEDLSSKDATTREDALQRQSQGRSMVEAAGQLIAWVEAWRKYRDEALPFAERQHYVLVMPPFGSVHKARGESEVFDPVTCVNRVDDNRYMRALLTKCVKGMTEEEVLAIEPPDAGAELWSQLQRIIHPDPTRLPFLLSMLKPQ